MNLKKMLDQLLGIKWRANLTSNCFGIHANINNNIHKPIDIMV